ncbi:hypothetical protein AX769_15520 [Frondihabitans sp. PAMC 28766]|uniref:DUF58 domain-containing protein n=1 Tax=Frondihabitans sp. PAMC 28766 TaxID=1795630 RepID=UPI00078DB309|nr:DUF58 domain-containing protein [Frondihabitans sp. PAMC 28766]AMM21283.1 hypothetical protein AX769_15520 [Frondihabitans sp. PAMC 28766]
MAGWSVLESVTVRAPGSVGAVSVRVRDTVGWRRMHSSEGVVTTIPAGSSSTVSFVLDDLPRGRHRVGPALVDVVEGFGMARRLVSVPGRSELTVLPEVVPIGFGRESRSLGEGSRLRRDHSQTGGQDDPITREYRRGDAMRRVHWKATARQGELMVRQEEQHGLPSTRVIVPVASANWRDWHPALGSGRPVSDGFEWAVSAAASIAVAYGLAGSQTRVVTLDGSTVAVHDPSTTPLFLDLLADLELDDDSSDRSPEASPREPVIAIVSSLGDADRQQLGRTRGPGVSGVAVVVHLDLDPLVPDDTAADSPSAVASALRADGWHVVDADSVSDVALVLSTAGVFGG